ncbi:hypothetical protein HAX54_043459, partial [Datura stramonium]|nr:hypothetical protein [Datura stramonium]
MDKQRRHRAGQATQGLARGTGTSTAWPSAMCSRSNATAGAMRPYVGASRGVRRTSSGAFSATTQ